ncbi:MAG: hypothetical protein JNK82_11515 [Myxococcaceae bacterium]|nr:hypothetical protein [Myxococcaceae bacterium]
MAKTVRRRVKTKALLVAAAGAAVVTFGACSGFTSGNLVAPPQCGADAGPPGCLPNEEPRDAGTDGGQGDGGMGGDQ